MAEHSGMNQAQTWSVAFHYIQLWSSLGYFIILLPLWLIKFVQQLYIKMSAEPELKFSMSEP